MMRKTFLVWLLAAALALPGCALFRAGTPPAVVQGGVLQAQGLQTYHANVERVLENYHTMLMEAYEQGLATWLTGRKTALTTEDGMISVNDYDALVLNVGRRLGAITANLEGQRRAALDKLERQYYTVLHLQSLLQRYNEASGVPTETFQQFLDAMEGLTEEIVAAQPEEVAEPDDPNAVDWGEVLRVLERSAYERLMSRIPRPLEEEPAPVSEPADP